MIKQKIGNVWCAVTLCGEVCSVRLYKWGQAKRCVAVVHHDSTFRTIKEGTRIDRIAVKGTLQQAIECLLETYRAYHETL